MHDKEKWIIFIEELHVFRKGIRELIVKDPHLRALGGCATNNLIETKIMNQEGIQD